MSGYLPIRDLGNFALPTGEREGIFVMLRAYFDDSGTHRDSKVVLMGGLIGTVQQWEGFERQWAAKLAAPLQGKAPLAAFHLTDCNSAQGEFRGYSRAERDALTHDFRLIIIEADLISTTSAIDRVAWNELVTGAAREGIESPVEICAAHCVQEAIRVAGAHPEGDAISVFFDQGIETNNMHRILDSFTYLLAIPRVMLISFGPVKKILPLQGADMAVTESYWHAIQWIDSGDTAEARAHFRHYLSNVKAEALILGREEIRAELARRAAEPNPDPPYSAAWRAE